MLKTFLQPSRKHPLGFTLTEILVVLLVVTIIMGTVILATSRTFSSAKKGIDTLSVMQGECIFLSYLKHDLRTLIISSELSIPPPVIVTDALGTLSLSFYKVETADDLGRPYPIRVKYLRQTAAGKYQAPDGSLRPTYLIQREVGNRPPKIFMDSMITSFSIELLDRAGGVLPDQAMAQAQMARVTLRSHLNELLKATACIYSPYLPTTLAGTSQECWHPNFRVIPYNPIQTGATTYSGLTLDPSDLEVIQGVGGIAIAEGMSPLTGRGNVGLPQASSVN